LAAAIDAQGARADGSARGPALCSAAMSSKHRASRRWWLLGTLAGALLVAATVPAGLLDAAPYLLPAVLLLAALAMRRYPGERALLSLISPSRRRRDGHRGPLAPARRSLRALLPRGGRLLGSSLAVRPPPRRLTAVLS
jgi:hypothetical protein